MDLEHTLEKAKRDHSGFKEIYDLTISRVFSFVLLRTQNREEALDICQDIYLSFWSSLPKFRYMGDAHFFSFLFLVSRRQIIKARIKKKDNISLDDIYDIESPEAEKEDYRFLLKQVGRLRDKERMCIELRYFEDLSFSQIAESMDIQENNAKVLHHRAITKLREFLPNHE